ncbi:MAG: CBS domain-containing protein [bacterium]|nr:CBS domain-containing protein [bacterium]
MIKPVRAIKALFDKISGKAAGLIDKAMMTEHTFMVIAAIIIGALAGSGTILIRFMIKEISSFTFGGGENLLASIRNTPWYIKLIAPAIGGLIVGPIIYFFAREAKRSGVPEVMQSVMLRGGFIRPRVAIIKAITASITIGTGGSVGREGPIVQIGSSIGSAVGQFFRVSNQRMKTFVGCGAAAGIAAAFNAPIAGTLFAVEIILQDFAFAQFSPIVISSVMATAISHYYKGNFAAFPEKLHYSLTSPIELLFYFVLAGILALIAVLFIKTIYLSEDLFDKKLPIPEYIKPAIGGLMIGAIALQYPQIMGVGYESINAALQGFEGETFVHLAIVLVLVKIVSTSITLGSGGSGGIFAPSLFLGAMTGVYFGKLVNALFPSRLVSAPEAYALVAMGGLVSAVTHAPITAIIMVFELTRSFEIILPLMITCIMSTILSTKMTRESVYTLKLVRRNIHLKYGSEIDIMKSIFVKDVYTREVEVIAGTSKFDEVVNRVITGKESYFPVISNERLQGMISLHDIKEHLYEKDVLQNLLIATDLANTDIETATPEDDCQGVLEKLKQGELLGIPVVDPAKPSSLLGMIWRRDIFNAYNREVQRRDVTSSFASKITAKNVDSTVHFMEGYSLTEIPIPQSFIGKSIKELNIRAKYGVDIILIRKNTNEGSKIKAIPNPDYQFSFNDSIMVAGEIGKINMLKSL